MYTIARKAEQMPPFMREPFSLEQIVEHDEEWASLIRSLRDLRRHHEAMVRRGDTERAVAALVGIRELRDPIFYAHRIWTERGRWNRYYRVLNGGLAHTGLSCRSVTPDTVAPLDWRLSGLDREAVARQYKLCRHCGSRDTTEVTGEMFRRLFVQHYLLDIV